MPSIVFILLCLCFFVLVMVRGASLVSIHRRRFQIISQQIALKKKKFTTQIEMYAVVFIILYITLLLLFQWMVAYVDIHNIRSY